MQSSQPAGGPLLPVRQCCCLGGAWVRVSVAVAEEAAQAGTRGVVTGKEEQEGERGQQQQQQQPQLMQQQQ